MDQIEQVLLDLSQKCSQAWKGKAPECAVCPVGEIAALVAAVLQFYRESKAGKPTTADAHWTTRWNREIKVSEPGKDPNRIT